MDKQAIIDKAAVLLDYIATGVEKGGDFVVEQAPLLTQEILAYGAVYYGLWLGVTVVATLIGGWVFWRGMYEAYHTYSDEWFVGCVTGGLISLVSFSFAVGNLLSLLKVYYAPRLFLLDTLRGLL